MKRSELRAEAVARIQDTDNVIATVAQVNGWINQAIKEIYRRYMWSFLRKRATVAVSTALTTIATDFVRATKVQHTDDGTILYPRSEDWLSKNYPPPVATGKPLYYCPTFVTGSPTTPARMGVRLGPTPDQSYNIEFTYRPFPADLTTDDDYPPLPEDFDEAILYWVMSRYYSQVEDTTGKSENKADFEVALRQLKTAYSFREAPTQLTDDPFQQET